MEPERTARRLAAIMATDVVGWSRMAAADEQRALADLNAHRAGVFDRTVLEHGGRIVKLMGDGALVEFRSVVDAVACAHVIQRATLDGGDTPDPIVLRIGVNLGDVIVQGDDIYGDGVNIAARLEQLSDPGGICISSAVHEIVRGRVDAAFVDAGEVSVKNIDRPLRIFRWSPAGTDPKVTVPARASARRVAIAVLPFDNRSDDPEQEYFSDGISEDIITDLSKVPGLAVIARNSSFVYKGRAVDLREVGRELGVTSVLEGSVRRAGDRMRITAQLIDADTGAHLWADRYDRVVSDFFALQDEVTFRIVEALKIRLTPSEQAEISGAGTESVEAHEQFMRLRGRLFFPGLTAAQWREAMAAGERAVALDPDYAQAYAVLGIMQVLDFHNQWSGRTAEDSLGLAERYAERALALAPDGILPNHAVSVAAFWRRDLTRAKRHIDRVLAVAGDYALAYFTRGEVSMGLGHYAEAIPDFEHAIRLDPAFRHQYLQFLAMSHFLEGHFETAVLMFRERVSMVPNTDIGRAWLSSALGHVGDAEQAMRVWAELRQISADFDLEVRLSRLPFTNPSAIERVLDGLRIAGLIESR